MEREKEERVVYNPFILQLLYQRVIFRERLGGVISLTKKTSRVSIIRENELDLYIVTEVVLLLRELYKQKIQFDPSLCIFEKALFQAFVLFYPKRSTIPEDLCQFSDEPLFRCEDFLFTILSRIGHNEEESRVFLTELFSLYLEEYYSLKRRDYLVECKARVSLFFRLKESLENAVLKHGVLFTYSEEEVMTLLYIFLLSELLSLNESIQSNLLHQFQTNPHQPNDERFSAESLLLSQLEKYEKGASLLKLLYESLVEYHKRELLLNLFDSPDGVVKLEEYSVGGNGETYRFLREKNGKGFMILPKSTSHLVYMKLSKDQHHYQYIVRRFLFDHHLYQSHEKLCFPGGSCRLCQYFDSDKSIRNLQEFYGIISSGRKDSRVFLENFILDRLEAIESFIFKNAWQLIKLVKSSSHLFYLIGVSEMVHEVRLNYEQYEGEGLYRQTLILKNAKDLVKSSNAFRLEKWQKELALDQDIYQLIFAAIIKQTRDLTKHARALCVDLKIASFLENLNADLSEIFTLYEQVLRDTMK